METQDSLRPTRTKRKEPEESGPFQSKKGKLTKTSSGVSGSYTTESTINYKPSFMFTAGKDPLFKLREDYKILNTLYKPFVIAINPLLFDSRLQEIYENYGISMEKSNKKEPQITKLPPNFKLDFKKSKIQILFEEGVIDFNQISKDYNLSRAQVKSYYEEFQKSNTILQTKKKVRKLQDEHLKVIKKFLESSENVSSTLTQIRDMLMQQFQFKDNKLSTETVRKAVDFLGFSRKKTTTLTEKHNSEANKELRKQTILAMTGILYQKKKVMYIDECSFHIGMVPLYGYSKKGTKAVSLTQPRSQNYTLLAAISDDGIDEFIVFKGSVKSGDFNGFMASLIMLLKLDENPREVVFFMDNATIHKNIDLREEIATQLAIVYNAPYSPYLNPIEECFSLWKHYVRKRKPQTERQLIEAILSAVHLISSSDCKKFIKHSIKLYTDCFKLKDLF